MLFMIDKMTGMMVWMMILIVMWNQREVGLFDNYDCDN
jgi:hypothetical protein